MFFKTYTECHGGVHRCEEEVDPDADTVETKRSFKK